MKKTALGVALGLLCLFGILAWAKAWIKIPSHPLFYENSSGTIVRWQISRLEYVDYIEYPNGTEIVIKNGIFPLLSSIRFATIRNPETRRSGWIGCELSFWKDGLNYLSFSTPDCELIPLADKPEVAEYIVRGRALTHAFKQKRIIAMTRASYATNTARILAVFLFGSLGVWRRIF